MREPVTTTVSTWQFGFLGGQFGSDCAKAELAENNTPTPVSVINAIDFTRNILVPLCNRPAVPPESEDSRSGDIGYGAVIKTSHIPVFDLLSPPVWPKCIIFAFYRCSYLALWGVSTALAVQEDAPYKRRNCFAARPSAVLASLFPGTMLRARSRGELLAAYLPTAILS